MSLDEQKKHVMGFYDQTKDTFDQSYDWHGSIYPSNRVRMDHCLDMLAKHGCHRVLDAGCGTGTILLELLKRGFDAEGFDFSEEAVRLCREKLKAHGFDDGRVTVSDIEDPKDVDNDSLGDMDYKYDAIIIMGAFTHPLNHSWSLDNLRRCVRHGGLLLVELRNEIFKLWAHDEMCLPLYEQMMPAGSTSGQALKVLGESLPTRVSVAENDDATKEHEKFFSVPSVWRNPLIVDAEYKAAGFKVFDKLYFHWHAAPPSYILDSQRAEMRMRSIELEHYPHDWRGLFMASAFILCATAD